MENEIVKVNRSHPAFRENAAPFYTIFKGFRQKLKGKKR